MMDDEQRRRVLQMDGSGRILEPLDDATFDELARQERGRILADPQRYGYDDNDPWIVQIREQWDRDGGQLLSQPSRTRKQ